MRRTSVWLRDDQIELLKSLGDMSTIIRQFVDDGIAKSNINNPKILLTIAEQISVRKHNIARLETKIRKWIPYFVVNDFCNDFIPEYSKRSQGNVFEAQNETEQKRLADFVESLKILDPQAIKSVKGNRVEFDAALFKIVAPIQHKIRSEDYQTLIVYWASLKEEKAICAELQKRTNQNIETSTRDG